MDRTRGESHASSFLSLSLTQFYEEYTLSSLSSLPCPQFLPCSKVMIFNLRMISYTISDLIYFRDKLKDRLMYWGLRS